MYKYMSAHHVGGFAVVHGSQSNARKKVTSSLPEGPRNRKRMTQQTGSQDLSQNISSTKKPRAAKKEHIFWQHQRPGVEPFDPPEVEVATKEVDQNARVIAVQERQLQDRRDLSSKIDQALAFHMGFLQDCIYAVTVIGGANKCPIENLRLPDLHDLLLLVFGDDPHEPGKTPDAFPTLNFYELIVALTGAAIYRWVFGDQFENDLLSTMSLANFGGHETLCNLDLAVFCSIIEDGDFKEVTVPKMSKMFASRLTKGLEPVYGENAASKATEVLQASLVTIFNKAIQVRLAVSASDPHFKCIWPKAGSEAAEEEMQSFSSTPRANGKVVKWPILPGLRIRPKHKTDTDVYGNAECSCTDWSEKVVAFKAVVRC